MATIEDIETQLKLLDDALREHGFTADEILRQVKNLQPEQLQLYSEAFQTGLPYITEGVFDAIAAGKSGNPFAISIASLSIFSGFLTLAGPLTGPVGPLISALTGLLSAILGQFLPAGKSIKEEITEVFEKFLAEQKLSDLGTAADQIWVFVDTVEHGKEDNPESKWKPLDLNSGPQITAIDNAWQWLANKEKQSLPQWGTVLEKTCRVFTQMLRAVTVSVAYPSKRPNATKGEMLVYLPSRMRKFLEYLRKITPVAQQRGTFWHLGSDVLMSHLEAGAVYTCDSILGADATWLNLRGNSRVMTVTLNEGQEGQSRPVVTLLTLEPPEHSYPGPKGPDDYDFYDKNQPFLKSNKRTYWVSGESPPPKSPWPQLMSNDSSHPLEECHDIFALPADTRYPGGIFFYTANGNEIRGYIQDKDGKVSFAWSYPVAGGRKVGSIRVVDRLRGFPDDPENPKRNPGVLKDIAWVIYGGCEVLGGLDILVRFAHKNGMDEGYVRAPWPNFRGIGVDRGYLWVYGAADIACATHTSIRKALKEHGIPSWMAYKGFPPGVVEKLSLDGNRLNGLVDLSPCDDGTLVAAFVEGNWNHNGQNELKLFMLTPRIDRKKKTLALQAADFVRIPGEGFRVRKQPLFCWSLLEETTATLEEQTAVPPESKTATSMLEDVAAELKEQTAPPAP
jgi:hypothetical protein